MSKKKKIALITTGVLVLGGVAAAIYVYNVNKKERAEKDHLAEVNKPVINPYA
jgi:hypothetical protein